MRELRLSDRENCSALRRLARTSWAAGCARPRSDWRAGPRWTSRDLTFDRSPPSWSSGTTVGCWC